MAVTFPRAAYADMFGPTVGDRVRLADTTLEADIMDKDLRAMDVLHRRFSGRDHDDDH